MGGFSPKPANAPTQLEQACSFVRTNRQPVRPGLEMNIMRRSLNDKKCSETLMSFCAQEPMNDGHDHEHQGQA